MPADQHNGDESNGDQDDCGQRQEAAQGEGQPGRNRARQGRDAGMVSVEAAVALSGLVAVLAMVLAGLVAVLAQIQCTDAAREAARLLARGETRQAQQIASQIAPSDAKLAISVTADTVSVTITADAAGGLLPGLRLHAHAVAVREPEAPDEPTAPTSTTPNQAAPATADLTPPTPVTGGNQ